MTHIAVYRVLKDRTQVPTVSKAPSFELFFSYPINDKDECEERRRFLNMKDINKTNGINNANNMNSVELTDWMPAIPLRKMSVLPGMMTHIDLNRKKSITALERATKGGNRLFLVSQKHIDTEEPTKEDLCEMGCIASVKQADRIAVLEEGTILHCGTHEELLQCSETYRDIYDSQMKSGAYMEGGAANE